MTLKYIFSVRNKIYAFLVWMIIVFILLSYMTLSSVDVYLLSGWFVPDGVTLYESAIRDSRLSTYEIFSSYMSAAGFAVVNAWSVGVSPLMPAILNSILLVIALSPNARANSKWPPALILVLTPYFISSAMLPSKDILVAALFMLAMRQFVEHYRLWSALLISIGMFFVRDGFALILGLLFIYIAFLEGFSIKAWKGLISLSVVSSIAWLAIGAVLDDTFLYARSVAIAEESETLSLNWSSPQGYWIRFFGNATNLALRPVPLDVNQNLHVLSFFYWVSGLTLLVAIYYSLKGVFSSVLSDRRLGTLGLGCLILVSVTPYVQPRYLLVLCFCIPFFSFATPGRLLRDLTVAIFIALIASMAYRLLDNYPPPPISMNFKMF